MSDSRSGRSYTQEFKDELCREVTSTSKPMVDMAKSYGVGADTLRRWLIKYRESHADPDTAVTGGELARLKDLERENQDLRLDNLDLKSQSLLREGAAVVSKYEYIESQRNDPAQMNPITKMCAWLALSTSGFYHLHRRPQSATAARRDALGIRIHEFFKDSDGTYGYRRIHADLEV
ncbi:transposase [Arthrobacter polaris]|uniref:transposase n=1 Tax=Arthrobacter polaris TaxID=2813727 RepID=UPI001F273FC4|nr:transposase [Arthrobacter polaris]UIK90268.1 transposase [Arthrobacter polaris]